MKSIFIKPFILFLFFNVTIPAQTFESGVKGRILEKSTAKPIIGANVYIAGTMWGTSSDLEGNYSIRALPSGTLELVVSMIGYEPVTKAIVLRNNAVLKLDFELIEKIYEYGEVNISAERPVEWEKNLIKFKELFLGSSEFVKECTIENEIMLDFERTSQNILIATSRQPLLIKNFALGFNIECIIQKFMYDEKNQRCQYKIAPTFKEMEAEFENSNGYWKQNRKIAYLGSLEHFLRTLKVDSLFSRGYKIQISESPMWGEFRVSNPIASSDSLITKGYFPDERILKFPDYLRVIYRDTYFKTDRISYLYLPYGRVTIDEYGYLHDDMGLQVLGDWTTRGIADLLPKYYFDL